MPAPRDERAGLERPHTRPRDRLTVALAVVIATGVGLAVGLDPPTTLRLVLALVVSLVLLVHVEWAALAVVATAVFADHLDAVSPWTTEWLAVVLVLAWVVRRAAGPLHRRGWPLVAVPAAALAALVLLSSVAHPHGRVGLDVAGRYAELLVVLVVLADVLAGPLRPVRAVRVYVLSCAAAAGCGLVTAVLSDSHRVAGPLERPDDLAFFLVAALPLVGTLRGPRTQAVWAVDPTRRTTPWLAWGCFVLLALGLLGTQSRAGYVAAVVVLVGAALTQVLSPQHAGAVLVLAATGVAFVLAVLPHPVGDVLGDPDGDPQVSVGAGVTQRLDGWRVAADLVAQQPALGVGPGGFALRDLTRGRMNDGPTTAYSTPLQVAAELGLLGAGALVAVVVVPAVALRRRRRTDPVSAAVLVAVVGTGVAALLETEQSLLPLWLLAALGSALARSGGPQTSGQLPP